MIKIIEANTNEQIIKAKSLFIEYAKSLNFNLCFQNFDAELENFPDQYSSPTGSLLLALDENEAIGCVGIRYFEKGICEMKRLYVKPKDRGKKAGKELALSAIKSAKALGYEYMRLDTLSSMENANHLSATGAGATPAVDIKSSVETEQLLNVS